MKIIIDAMGGDNAPYAPVEAAVKAVKELGVDIVLVGQEKVVNGELKKYSYPQDKISVVNAEEVITNFDEPAKAIRVKKNSSMVVAARMLKNNEGDALLSMGNTGALLSAGLLIVGRIKGILRPALATALPSGNGPMLLVDAGANTNCKPLNLLQFAMMGSIYSEEILGIEKPKVGLLSNGEEEGKGNDLVKQAYPLFKEAPFNFVGNVEGRDVMNGDVNVIACEGFVGNVVLKTVEGMGSLMGDMVKGMFVKNIFTKLGAIFVSGGIKDFKKRMDYREYGGAPLLGVKSPVIKGHGSSDAKAVFQAIVQAKKTIETNMVDKIKNSLLLINEAALMDEEEI